MVDLHRVEYYGDNHVEGAYVSLSFYTQHRGIWQCRWTETGMREYAEEPPFESLKEAEQQYIERAAAIIFLLTHGKPPKI